MAKNDSSQMKECLTHDCRNEESREKVRSESDSGSCPRRRHSESSRNEGTGSSKQNHNTEPESMKTYPLEKMKREPECHMELDKLCIDRNHTMLIDVNKFNEGEIAPYKVAAHVWDGTHVKLPNCPVGPNESRWSAIKTSLKRLEHDSTSVGDVESAIMAYNSAYARTWKFDALQGYVRKLPTQEKNQFSKKISKIAKLALKLPDLIKCPIPLLKIGRNHSLTMSQEQIACLLANAFFCTFPHRNTKKPGSEYSNFPSINFSSLFADHCDRKVQKLRTLFHYFHTVTEPDTKPKGLVTFERISLDHREFPKWEEKKETLTNLHVSSEGLIEREGKGMLQVDFACKFIGGGVIGRGLVQEEIRFLQCPELIVARLFTERLNDNECLKITGAQTYSRTTGYSDSFEWVKPHDDDTERDNWKRRFCQIVAIDALSFKNPHHQFKEDLIRRELNKAYVGFKPDHNTPDVYIPAIATGNWGCGAFNGDHELKALIQMMAAAVAQRDLAYFTFKNKKLAEELMGMHHMLKTHHVSVGKLYKLLKDYCNHVSRHQTKSKSVFQYIQDKDLFRSQL